MNLSIDSYIREQFAIEGQDPRMLSPLTLAFVGDAVFDLIIRSLVVGKGNTQANRLHQKKIKIVNAGAQAMMIRALEPILTEEEAGVYRRGRNAKSPTTAKNASVGDYRKATGFEALIGYLYLSDQFERAVELSRLGVEMLEKEA